MECSGDSCSGELLSYAGSMPGGAGVALRSHILGPVTEATVLWGRTEAAGSGSLLLYYALYWPVSVAGRPRWLLQEDSLVALS